MSRATISRIERGVLFNVPLGTIHSVAEALDATVDHLVRWHGGDLSRLINARHAAMHEAIAHKFASLDGWVAEPEVSFSVYGERGVIDTLGWHAATGSLLVVELKTEIVDVSELMGTLDRKRRLARDIAAERGWHARKTSTWVLVADSHTNRRALSMHGSALQSKLPTDGRGMRSWLRSPHGTVNALAFMPSAHGVSTGRGLSPIRRVSKPRRSLPSA